MTSAEIITKCPFCGEVHEVATGVAGMKDEVPHDDAIGLCFQCGEWTIFDLSLEGKLRKPLAREYLGIGLDIGLQSLREAWLEVRK